MTEKEIKALRDERDALRGHVAELQVLAQTEEQRHHAERDALNQQASDARAALANAMAGDGALHKLLRQLLEEGPPATEERRQAVMAWIRTHHEAEPLRRHIDLHERGRRLIVQEAEIADWRDRFGQLGEKLQQVAREKHEHAERANAAEARCVSLIGEHAERTEEIARIRDAEAGVLRARLAAMGDSSTRDELLRDRDELRTRLRQAAADNLVLREKIEVLTTKAKKPEPKAATAEPEAAATSGQKS